MGMIYTICGVAGFLLILFLASYVKTNSQVALVISGLSKKPKVLIGTSGFCIPFLQRKDRLYLGEIEVDIKTTESVPTSDFINVDVDAVAKIRVKQMGAGLECAISNFLNKNPEEISNRAKGVLQGNMREIVGTLDLRSLNTDRDGFSNQIQQKASKDMDMLGIEILSCNIQSVTDREGLIEALGADNTCKITKDAAINKALATKDVEIAKADAEKEANNARVQAATAIAEKNNELAIKKSELKIQEDIKRAEADAAYEIQKQEQAKTIKVKTVEAQAAEAIVAAERQKQINAKEVEAEVEKATKIQELKTQEIAIKQKMLEAEINKKADAEKYQKEVNAMAELEQRKRKAEAETYEAEQKAKAKRAEAEAMKFAMEQEALGIRAKGEAEAYAILKKGEAEAEAMNKKADAYQKYNDAAVVEMLVGILPEMAKNVADPIKAIDNVTIYGGGDGNGVSGVSANVPMVIKQTFDTVSNATGVDLSKILEAHTINAKTDRNIELKGGSVDVEATGKQILHD
jgi:flotillin